MQSSVSLRRDGYAAIGITAMIVFIAIILVCAMISAIIIQTMDKLGEEAEDKRSDRAESKVVVETILIFRFEPCWQSTSTDPNCAVPYGHHQLLMNFHLSGSEDVAVGELSYLIVCTESGMLEPARSTTFQDSNAWRATGANMLNVVDPPFEAGHAVHRDLMLNPVADGSRATTLTPGEDYSLMIELYDNQNTGTSADDEGCRISLDYSVDLFIFVEGGMMTYETIQCYEYEILSRCA